MSYSHELELINERLASIEIAIKELTLAIQALTNRNMPAGVVQYS